MKTDPSSPRVLATFTSEAEAALVANCLDQEGIRAMVAGSDPGTGWPDTRCDVQVVVRQGDLARAAELLEMARRGELRLDPEDIIEENGEIDSTSD